MISSLRYTLIADGSSDSALLHIVKWVLDDLYPRLSHECSFADFRDIPDPPKPGNISERIKIAKKFWPFDILLYHRDAEKRDKDIIGIRKKEILESQGMESINVVCIVPIVMTEAWLLIDETAIKKAAGNRNYNGSIELPSLKRLENETNPKELLHELLKEASGIKNRRREKFNIHRAVHLVSENIQDFSSLRQLEAFKIFEKDIQNAVNQAINNH